MGMQTLVSLVLDFSTWWRHVKTSYSLKVYTALTPLTNGFFLYFVVEFQQFTTCFAVDLMFYVSGDDMRPLQNTQLDLKADFVNLLENVLGLANHNDN